MQRCRECGMPVEFRFIDGRCIPLHTNGGCSYSDQRVDNSGTRRSAESECRKTSCPMCNATVYFIRHNGGSVWIEPPLGPPWERHSCFLSEESGIRFVSPISSELKAKLGANENLVTGVVRLSEISKDRRQTILEVNIGADEALSILIKGGADSLLGQLVIIAPDKRRIYRAAEARICFNITAVLAGPEALTARGAPLSLRLSPEQMDKVRADIKHGELSDRQHRARRKYQSQGLSGAWKLSELMLVIPLVTSKDKDRAVHMAAIMVIERAEGHGDCSGAAILVLSLPKAKQKRIIDWFWEHSPIRIDLLRKSRKAYIHKTVEGIHRPFRSQLARTRPI